VRKNKVTLKDIAAMTGYSPASISMVLSGKMLERFSDKTIREQMNLLRVVDNERYPAFFEWQGNRYYLAIWREKKKSE